ncbi:oocyte zinc finger protein XlCOF7.1 [Aedes albopictus]|uniref:C2H2-type domain-containing protein n=1 Tax=Aedes albopictus TaxID=7160 RepID=A0ABM2A0H8_AEDAL|nr:hypothetical protein RP20_CCG019688 [Aedes albopictus]
MLCSFCKKGAPTLVTHHLCNCCLENLRYSPKSPTAVVPTAADDDTTAGVRIQCDICLEEFQDDQLEQHQDVCMPRVALRCNVCEQDYLTQEGLWNHLDLHEITDDKKELHYKERRSQHVLHRCELCNDQRGYQESSYWRHVHEDHDGFFLRCSECGDCFRSRKLRTEHSLKRCQAREQAVPSDFEQHKVVSGFNENNLSVNKPDKIPDADPLEQTGLPLPNAVAQEIQNEKENVPSDDSSTAVEATSHGDNPDPITDTTCLTCGKDCKNLFILNRHTDTVHRKMTCEICDTELVGSNQYRYHKLRYHSEPFYKCNECQKQFYRLGTFRRHMVSHSTAKRYKCNLCHQKFKGLEYLEMHRMRIHRIMPPSDAPSSVSQNPVDGTVQQPRQGTVEDTLGVVCDICKLPFASKAELKVHENVKHGVPRYKCPHCPEMFRQRKTFDSHLAKHVGIDKRGKKRTMKVVGRTFATTRCAECNNKDYRTAKGLTRHVDACHAPMTCPICGVVSLGRGRSQYHKLVCHTDPTYFCPHCSKKFHVRMALRTHLRQHNDIREEDIPDFRYERKQFDQMYKLKETSTVEQETEDSNSQTGEDDEKIVEPQKSQKKPRSATSCRECFGEYYSKKALNNHIYLRHTPIVCKICGITSSGTQKANHHERTKHSDQPQQCPRCPRKFQAKSDLCRHLEIHTRREKIANQQNISNSNEIEIGDVAKSEAIHHSDSERAANLEELVLGYPDPDPDQQDQISPSTEAIDKQTNQADTMYTKDDQEDSCDSQTESFSEVAEQESENQMLENQAEKLPCQHCDKSFDNSQSHILHVKQNHTLCNCKICGATIAGMNNLNYHELIYHSEAKFKCSYCPKSFHLSSTHRYHEDWHSKLTTTNHEPPPDSESEVSIHNIKTECPSSPQAADESNSSCNESITFEDLLIKIESTSEQPNPSENFDVVGESSSPKPSGKKPADRNFAGKKPCTICKKWFKKSILSSHIKCTHELCKCAVCGEEVTGTNQLKYHELVTHAEPKLECSYCSKKFHLQAFLNRHLKKHLNIPMYNPVSPPKPNSDPESADEASCSDELLTAMKEKTTLPKPNLEKSGRRVARETSVGKRSEPKRSKKKSSPKKSAGDFSCPHCPKSFKIERSFTLHVRYTHELYKCDVCGITLVGWNQLKYHELKVHSEPRFKCSYCSKQFHVKSAYTRHEVWHSKKARPASPDSDSNLSVHESVVGIKSEIEDGTV